MRLHRWLQAGGGLVLFACLPVASAQYARKLDSLISRPSGTSPSELIGGTYTREAARPLESTRGQNASLLGQRSMPFRGALSNGRDARVMTNGIRGLGSGGGRSRAGGGAAGIAADFDTFRNREGEIGIITGLTAALNLELPLPGVPIGHVPSLSACDYTPRRETTRLHDVLGLVPAAPPPAEASLGTAAERLESHTAELVSHAQVEGLALFKQATVEPRDVRTGRFENCADCAEKMARAIQRLRMVSDLAPDSGLPLLLMAHAALDQERPLQAIQQLLEALRRERSVFSDAAGPVAQYFGDADSTGRTSAFLEGQMRRYMQIGVYNRDSSTAQALQAYCAWRLGDRDTARVALSQLEKLAATAQGQTEDLLSFAAALRVAMR